MPRAHRSVPIFPMTSYTVHVSVIGRFIGRKDEGMQERQTECNYKGWQVTAGVSNVSFPTPCLEMFQKRARTLPTSLTRFGKRGLDGSALYKEGMGSISFHTTNKCNSDVIYLKNLTAKTSNLWKLSVLQIIWMPGTAFQWRQERCLGSWLQEWAKKLHTKLQFSWSVQMCKNQAQKYCLPYKCGCTHSSHQHRCTYSTEVKVWSYLNCFNR